MMMEAFHSWRVFKEEIQMEQLKELFFFFSSFIYEDTCLLLISGLQCSHSQAECFQGLEPFGPTG